LPSSPLLHSRDVVRPIVRVMSCWASVLRIPLHRPVTHLGGACKCRAAAASWSEPVGRAQQSITSPIRASAKESTNSREDEDVVEASPSHRPSYTRDDALPLSLYAPFTDLPADGKIQTEAEETCDPMTRNCQRPMYVWESKCRPCYGTGSICSSSRRGRRTSYVCPTCHGLGVVRKTSSRVMPDIAAGNGQFTAARPPAPTADPGTEPRRPRLDRWRNRKKE